MNSDYKNLTYIKDEKVSEIGPWLWINSDVGAWQGPKIDWESSHINVLLNAVKDFTACVQAGGNQGMYPRLLADYFRNVYTFEPDPLNFYCLAYNCQMDNIHKLQAALGATTGLARVERQSMINTGCHTISTDGICSVPMLTIDSLKLPYCGFIQLDIEGYEANALIGALETIERCKPVIQCERGGENILSLLKPFGYKILGTSAMDTVYSID